MFRLELFCLLFISSWTLTLTAWAWLPQPGSSYEWDGTRVVDNLMEAVRSRIIAAGLDDLSLPDVSLEVFGQNLSVYNQSLIGMANFYRVGEVFANSTWTTTVFRSAFAVYNVSTDAEVAVHTRILSYEDGHIHKDCDNITGYQVITLEHWTLILTLEEFELTVGECVHNVTGLGKLAEYGSQITTALFQMMKEPMFKYFSVTFKNMINSILLSSRRALIGYN